MESMTYLPEVLGGVDFVLPLCNFATLEFSTFTNEKRICDEIESNKNKWKNAKQGSKT